MKFSDFFTLFLIGNLCYFNSGIYIKEREGKRVQIYLDEVNQSEKTIIFCATQAHAAMVRDLVSPY